MSNGTTGIITYLLLKYNIGNDDVPFNITSTYFNCYFTFDEVIYNGSL